MKRISKILCSLLLMAFSFSGHTFQVQENVIDTLHPTVQLVHLHQNFDKINLDVLGDIKPSDIKYVYNSIKDAPKYPKGFKAVQNGTGKFIIKNKLLLNKLRVLYPGKWYKVYKNGYNSSLKRVSIHFFQHESGKVFDVKVINKWSTWG
ncbi:hypothetical protein PSI23_10995 [Xenorhabdus sp. XENO-10]|uniref:Uncharacterized protein n=1 Tax=Xenorhabdus yunnanensis TaxID=3025878 RepID=A0ABT5LFR3_9GAMM|nr:hypothetical protein [Xenorhabdus yunnanensis]MDC9589809.1 hypothetical protein [Xenorhabdus yunnanensis]